MTESLAVVDFCTVVILLFFSSTIPVEAVLSEKVASLWLVVQYGYVFSYGKTTLHYQLWTLLYAGFQGVFIPASGIKKK